MRLRRPGMLDAACPGQVFTSPTPDQMLAAAAGGRRRRRRAVHRQELRGRRHELRDGGRDAAEGAGSPPCSPTTTSPSRTRPSPPAGAASPAPSLVEKIVGAAAEAGARSGRLHGARRAGQRARPRSMGVALTSCTVPAAGRPTFELGEDEMEIGVGIHGEPGRGASSSPPADAIAERDARRRHRRPRAAPGPPVLAAGQRLRRHAARWSSTSCTTRPARTARRPGVERRPLAGRQLHHLARHGRLLAHPDPRSTTS